MTAFKNRECHCDSLEASHEMLSVKQAKEAALELARPIRETELVPLCEALGRIVSKDLRAPTAMPFFDNSAMDGYAVCTRSFNGYGPWRLKVEGTIAAGDHPFHPANDIPPKHALRIFTGAPVPESFDAVIPLECVAVHGSSIVVKNAPTSGDNIRYAGTDMARGSVLISAGMKINPHHVGLLAANGYNAVNVKRRPRVGIFSTGDELTMAGDALQSGKIYDCNKPMLLALFSKFGIRVDDLGTLKDNLAATQNLLDNCRNHYDLVISTGSVSVGERDFLKTAFLAVGGFVRNWKVAVKPGKPVLFGSLGNTAFTGLPGNPFAVFVGFHLFVKPQLLQLSGAKPIKDFSQAAIASFSLKRKPGRSEVFPVRIVMPAGSGLPSLQRCGNSVSATLFPLARADGLAMVDSGCEEIRPGDIIRWESFCW
jgi:molybdopterin molybdotransferase